MTFRAFLEPSPTVADELLWVQFVEAYGGIAGGHVRWGALAAGVPAWVVMLIIVCLDNMLKVGHLPPSPAISRHIPPDLTLSRPLLNMLPPDLTRSRPLFEYTPARIDGDRAQGRPRL